MNNLKASRDFFRVETQARLQMIEILMRLVGYDQLNARAYRRHLLAMDHKELAEFYHKLLEEI